MNNKVIIGIIAVIVILGVIFFANRGNDGSSEVDSDGQSAQSSTQVQAESGSIKSLIADGGSRKCTFKTMEQGVESSGTMYVSGGKMRGDFTSMVADTEVMSHMIYDGTASYVWTDGQTTGFKMAFDANETTTSQNQSVDVNKNYEFDCEGWSVDESKFSPPSNIQFSELPTVGAGMSGDAQTSGTINSKEIQKAACNDLPEPAKAQCLAAIQ